MRMPLLRAIRAICCWALLPGAPVSANPEVNTMALRAPALAQSAITSTATEAGTETTTQSTGSGTEAMSG